MTPGEAVEMMRQQSANSAGQFDIRKEFAASGGEMGELALRNTMTKASVWAEEVVVTAISRRLLDPKTYWTMLTPGNNSVVAHVGGYRVKRRTAPPEVKP